MKVMFWIASILTASRFSAASLKMTWLPSECTDSMPRSSIDDTAATPSGTSVKPLPRPR